MYAAEAGYAPAHLHALAQRMRRNNPNYAAVIYPSASLCDSDSNGATSYLRGGGERACGVWASFCFDGWRRYMAGCHTTIGYWLQLLASGGFYHG